MSKCNYFIEIDNEKIHLGKHMDGWKFALHVTDIGKTWNEIKNFILDNKYKIFNELDKTINKKDFINIVEEDQNNKKDPITFHNCPICKRFSTCKYYSGDKEINGYCDHFTIKSKMDYKQITSYKEKCFYDDENFCMLELYFR